MADRLSVLGEREVGRDVVVSVWARLLLALVTLGITVVVEGAVEVLVGSVLTVEEVRKVLNSDF